MSDPLPPPSTPAPPVLTWYRVYLAAMTLLFVVFTVAMVISPAPAPRSGHLREMGWLYPLLGGCVGLPFVLAFGAAFALPRRPWAWVYHLVLIGIGLTSVCCIPVCIPLLIFWLKPETKRYFGRQA